MHWIRASSRPRSLRDRAGEHRLGRARHVLEQHVAAAGERGEDERDLPRLPWTTVSTFASNRCASALASAGRLDSSSRRTAPLMGAC